MKVAVAVLLLALGAGKKKPPAKPAPPPPPTEPSPKLAEALTEKPTAMLTATTKMTLFKVTSQPGVRPNPQLAVGGEYEKQGAGRELTEGEVKRFKELVYNEKSFKFDKPPPCGEFKPEFAMLAQSDADTGILEMLISFKCGGLMFFTAKTAGRSLPGAQLDFKPSRKPLLTMVKELMPQDGAVQGLK